MTEDTPQEPEEKYRWIVMFKKGGKLYTYLNRTIPFMTAVIGKYRDEHAEYPYRVWVVVDDEIQKVVIS